MYISKLDLLYYSYCEENMHCLVASISLAFSAIELHDFFFKVTHKCMSVNPQHYIVAEQVRFFLSIS